MPCPTPMHMVASHTFRRFRCNSSVAVSARASAEFQAMAMRSHPPFGFTCGGRRKAEGGARRALRGEASFNSITSKSPI